MYTVLNTLSIVFFLISVTTASVTITINSNGYHAGSIDPCEQINFHIQGPTNGSPDQRYSVITLTQPINGGLVLYSSKQPDFRLNDTHISLIINHCNGFHFNNDWDFILTSENALATEHYNITVASSLIDYKTAQLSYYNSAFSSSVKVTVSKSDYNPKIFKDQYDFFKVDMSTLVEYSDIIVEITATPADTKHIGTIYADFGVGSPSSHCSEFTSTDTSLTISNCDQIFKVVNVSTLSFYVSVQRTPNDYSYAITFNQKVKTPKALGLNVVSPVHQLFKTDEVQYFTFSRTPVANTRVNITVLSVTGGAVELSVRDYPDQGPPFACQPNIPYLTCSATFACTVYDSYCPGELVINANDPPSTFYVGVKAKSYQSMLEPISFRLHASTVDEGAKIDLKEGVPYPTTLYQNSYAFFDVPVGGLATNSGLLIELYLDSGYNADVASSTMLFANSFRNGSAGIQNTNENHGNSGCYSHTNYCQVTSGYCSIFLTSCDIARGKSPLTNTSIMSVSVFNPHSAISVAGLGISVSFTVQRGASLLLSSVVKRAYVSGGQYYHYLVDLTGKEVGLTVDVRIRNLDSSNSLTIFQNPNSLAGDSCYSHNCYKSTKTYTLKPNAQQPLSYAACNCKKKVNYFSVFGQFPGSYKVGYQYSVNSYTPAKPQESLSLGDSKTDTLLGTQTYSIKGPFLPLTSVMFTLDILEQQQLPASVYPINLNVKFGSGYNAACSGCQLGVSCSIKSPLRSCTAIVPECEAVAMNALNQRPYVTVKAGSSEDVLYTVSVSTKYNKPAPLVPGAAVSSTISNGFYNHYQITGEGGSSLIIKAFNNEESEDSFTLYFNNGIKNKISKSSKAGGGVCYSNSQKCTSSTSCAIVEDGCAVQPGFVYYMSITSKAQLFEYTIQVDFVKPTIPIASLNQVSTFYAYPSQVLYHPFTIDWENVTFGEFVQVSAEVSSAVNTSKVVVHMDLLSAKLAACSDCNRFLIGSASASSLNTGVSVLKIPISRCTQKSHTDFTIMVSIQSPITVLIKYEIEVQNQVRPVAQLNFNDPHKQTLSSTEYSYYQIRNLKVDTLLQLTFNSGLPDASIKYIMSTDEPATESCGTTIGSCSAATQGGCNMWLSKCLGSSFYLSLLGSNNVHKPQSSVSYTIELSPAQSTAIKNEQVVHTPKLVANARYFWTFEEQPAPGATIQVDISDFTTPFSPTLELVSAPCDPSSKSYKVTCLSASYCNIIVPNCEIQTTDWMLSLSGAANYDTFTFKLRFINVLQDKLPITGATTSKLMPPLTWQTFYFTPSATVTALQLQGTSNNTVNWYFNSNQVASGANCAAQTASTAFSSSASISTCCYKSFTSFYVTVFNLETTLYSNVKITSSILGTLTTSPQATLPITNMKLSLKQNQLHQVPFTIPDAFPPVGSSLAINVGKASSTNIQTYFNAGATNAGPIGASGEKYCSNSAASLRPPAFSQMFYCSSNTNLEGNAYQLGFLSTTFGNVNVSDISILYAPPTPLKLGLTTVESSAFTSVDFAKIFVLDTSAVSVTPLTNIKLGVTINKFTITQDVHVSIMQYTNNKGSCFTKANSCVIGFGTGSTTCALTEQICGAANKIYLQVVGVQNSQVNVSSTVETTKAAQLAIPSTTDISTQQYFTINLENREATYKFSRVILTLSNVTGSVTMTYVNINNCFATPKINNKVVCSVNSCAYVVPMCHFDSSTTMYIHLQYTNPLRLQLAVDKPTINELALNNKITEVVDMQHATSYHLTYYKVSILKQDVSLTSSGVTFTLTADCGLIAMYVFKGDIISTGVCSISHGSVYHISACDLLSGSAFGDYYITVSSSYAKKATRYELEVSYDENATYNYIPISASSLVQLSEEANLANSVFTYFIPSFGQYTGATVISMQSSFSTFDVYIGKAPPCGRAPTSCKKAANSLCTVTLYPCDLSNAVYLYIVVNADNIQPTDFLQVSNTNEYVKEVATTDINVISTGNNTLNGAVYRLEQEHFKISANNMMLVTNKLDGYSYFEVTIALDTTLSSLSSAVSLTITQDAVPYVDKHCKYDTSSCGTNPTRSSCTLSIGYCQLDLTKPLYLSVKGTSLSNVMSYYALKLSVVARPGQLVAVNKPLCTSSSTSYYQIPLPTQKAGSTAATIVTVQFSNDASATIYTALDNGLGSKYCYSNEFKCDKQCAFLVGACSLNQTTSTIAIITKNDVTFTIETSFSAQTSQTVVEPKYEPIAAAVSTTTKNSLSWTVYKLQSSVNPTKVEYVGSSSNARVYYSTSSLPGDCNATPCGNGKSGSCTIVSTSCTTSAAMPIYVYLVDISDVTFITTQTSSTPLPLNTVLSDSYSSSNDNSIHSFSIDNVSKVVMPGGSIDILLFGSSNTAAKFNIWINCDSTKITMGKTTSISYCDVQKALKQSGGDSITIAVQQQAVTSNTDFLNCEPNSYYIKATASNPNIKYTDLSTQTTPITTLVSISDLVQLEEYYSFSATKDIVSVHVNGVSSGIVKATIYYSNNNNNEQYPCTEVMQSDSKLIIKQSTSNDKITFWLHVEGVSPLHANAFTYSVYVSQHDLIALVADSSSPLTTVPFSNSPLDNTAFINATVTTPKSTSYRLTISSTLIASVSIYSDNTLMLANNNDADITYECYDVNCELIFSWDDISDSFEVSNYMIVAITTKETNSSAITVQITTGTNNCDTSIVSFCDNWDVFNFGSNVYNGNNAVATYNKLVDELFCNCSGCYDITVNCKSALKQLICERSLHYCTSDAFETQGIYATCRNVEILCNINDWSTNELLSQFDCKHNWYKNDSNIIIVPSHPAPPIITKPTTSTTTSSTTVIDNIGWILFGVFGGVTLLLLIVSIVVIAISIFRHKQESLRYSLVE